MSVFCVESITTGHEACAFAGSGHVAVLCASCRGVCGQNFLSIVELWPSVYAQNDRYVLQRLW